MSKPKSLPSEAPKSSSSEPHSGYQQIMSSTLPGRVPGHKRIAEPFPVISATILLGLDVSHSGWVRKEGFGYKNCKFCC